MQGVVEEDGGDGNSSDAVQLLDSLCL